MQYSATPVVSIQAVDCTTAAMSASVTDDPSIAPSRSASFTSPMLVLRRLIHRIKAIAHQQFTGNARILETLQEAVHGIRIVKAYTLEDAMPPKAYRWVAEMQEIADFVADDPAARALYSGAAQFYQQIAQDFAGEKKDVDALAAFLKKHV